MKTPNVTTSCAIRSFTTSLSPTYNFVTLPIGKREQMQALLQLRFVLFACIKFAHLLMPEREAPVRQPNRTLRRAHWRMYSCVYIAPFRPRESVARYRTG
eukprot:IDg18441t1